MGQNLAKFLEIAGDEYDGHFTILGFTTHVKAAFGTMRPEDFTYYVFETLKPGKDIEEACRIAIENEQTMEVGIDPEDQYNRFIGVS